MRLTGDTSRPLLLDGAMGTELIARGLRVREECPEAWNLERPDEVRQVHAAYAAAGAQLVQTNTFGGVRPRLARFGLAERQYEVLLRAVQLAREGAPGLPVVGSLGPTGETLPLGTAPDLGWLEQAFAEAAAILAEARVDALHLETMFHPAELLGAIRGARAGAPGLPLVASMTIMPGVTGLETPHGVPIARMVKAIQAGEPDAVGVNCSVEAERMAPAISALAEQLPLPIWARPQAKVSQKCATWTPSETAANFAAFAARLVDAGASAIGGCCGVGPSWIAELKRTLDGKTVREVTA